MKTLVENKIKYYEKALETNKISEEFFLNKIEKILDLQQKIDDCSELVELYTNKLNSL